MLKRYEYDGKTPTDKRACVSELMSRELLTVSKTDNLKTVEELFELKMVRHLPVTDDRGMLVGLVTQRDFLKYAISNLAHLPRAETAAFYQKIQVHEVMARKVVTVTPDTPLGVAAETMLRNKFSSLPVVENGRLVGIITESDFVETYAGVDS